MFKNEQIQSEFESVDWSDSNSVVQFYENNLIFFDNIPETRDIGEIIEICHIKISYLFALINKAHYTKAEKLLTSVENFIQKVENSNEFEEINERFLNVKGRILHHSNKYEDSLKIFQELVKKDPDNDNYKRWLESNKNFVLYNKIKVIAFIGIGLFAFSMILEVEEKVSRDFSLRLEILSLILMLFGFYGYRLRGFLRKYLEKK